MSKRNVIRVAVLAGLLAWPGVEYYRYQVAKKQLAASIELRRDVTERLASLRQRHSPSATPASESVVPVKNETAPAVPGSKGI